MNRLPNFLATTRFFPDTVNMPKTIPPGGPLVFNPYDTQFFRRFLHSYLPSDSVFTHLPVRRAGQMDNQNSKTSFSFYSFKYPKKHHRYRIRYQRLQIRILNDLSSLSI
jgi:hypothetical protein